VPTSGRSAHEPAVLISSGSRLAAALGLGNSIAGSRNHSRTRASSSTGCGPSFKWSVSWPHTSWRISSRVQRAATLPVRRPGVCQSETSTERIPRTWPSPYPARSTSGQNCAWEIEVSAHSEST
jgi:hypothetical protein